MNPSVASSTEYDPPNGLIIRAISRLTWWKTLDSDSSMVWFRFLTNFNRTPSSPYCLSAPFSFHSSTDRSSPHSYKVAAADPASCSCNFKFSGTWFLSQKFQCVSTLAGLYSLNHCGKVGDSALIGFAKSYALFLELRIELGCHKHLY